MNKQELKDLLLQKFPQLQEGDKYPETADVTLLVKKEDLLEVCRYLKEEPELDFNHLMVLTAVDYLSFFEVVYYLYSISNRQRLVLKVVANKKEPSVPSLTCLWPTANWHEREVYDLFGIRFTGHPNLKRIMLPDDWHGHPLCKDYQNERVVKRPVARELEGDRA